MPTTKYAQMAELVYAPVLGTGSRKGLEVRVLFWAQMKTIIEKKYSGERIDKFLSSFAKASADKEKEFFANGIITRGEIKKQIRDGNILINKKTTKPSYVLKVGDQIEINFEKKDNKVIPNEKTDFKILYQDKNIIVIDKPAGLQVHPSTKDEKNTLINGLLYKFPEIENVGEDPTRPGIVHRLDRETSGVMVAAKNQKTFLELKKKFQKREIQKTYWAVVLGNFGEDEKKGIIEKPLAKAKNYKKQVIAGGKTTTKVRPAITQYEVLQEFPEYSLVEAQPKTGRTHQIRVHLFSIGHPVLGDSLYKAKKMKISLVAPSRHLLHAKKLEFELFGKKYAFESDLPSDFEHFLSFRTHTFEIRSPAKGSTLGQA